MGEDLARGVGDEVVGHIGEARGVEEGRFPHAAVADGAPLDGVAGDAAAALLDVGIETDADDLHLPRVLLIAAQQHALDVDALVVPRAPDSDDVDGGIEIGGGDGAPVEVGGGEGGQFAAVFEAGEALELADEIALLLPGGLL